MILKERFYMCPTDIPDPDQMPIKPEGEEEDED